jgi:hypothetical protein
MRLIPWIPHCGSEQFIYNWNSCGSRIGKAKGWKRQQRNRKTDGITSRVEDNTHTVEERQITRQTEQGKSLYAKRLPATSPEGSPKQCVTSGRVYR